jgi:hypothetical protein
MLLQNTNTKEKALRSLERQLARLEWVAGFFLRPTAPASPDSGGTMVIISPAPATSEHHRILEGLFTECRSRGEIDIWYSVLTPSESLAHTNS